MPKADPWMICPTCEGDGKHVNPNIDAGGISGDTFDANPGFAEAYFAGVYDVPCRTCDTTGKIRESDHARLLDELEQAADERELAALESGEYASGLRDHRFGF